MKKDEWHKNYNEIMTQLCEAQEQLKAAPLNSIESQEAHREVGARMHDIDCLTNVSLTPIETEDDVEVTANVAPVPGRNSLVSVSDVAPQAADLLRGHSTQYRPDTYLTDAMDPHQDQENLRRHLYIYRGKS